MKCIRQTQLSFTVYHDPARHGPRGLAESRAIRDLNRVFDHSSGLIFFRATPAARAFLQAQLAWQEAAVDMADDQQQHIRIDVFEKRGLRALA